MKNSNVINFAYGMFCIETDGMGNKFVLFMKLYKQCYQYKTTIQYKDVMPLIENITNAHSVNITRWNLVPTTDRKFVFKENIMPMFNAACEKMMQEYEFYQDFQKEEEITNAKEKQAIACAMDDGSDIFGIDLEEATYICDGNVKNTKNNTMGYCKWCGVVVPNNAIYCDDDCKMSDANEQSRYINHTI